MNDWGKTRLLLSLLLHGEAKVTRALDEEVAFLCRLGWATRHRGTAIRLKDIGKSGVRERLDAVWPEWETASRAVREADDDPLDEDAYHRLRVRVGVASFPAHWPRQVNRRTAAALLAGSAKAPLTERHRAQVGSEEITRDDVLRVRAFTPLTVTIGGCLTADVAMMTSVAGDMPLPERSFALQEWAGDPAIIVTVENKGAFIDLPEAPGALVIHCPGYNIDLSLTLIERWNCPVVHFGDFDADGLAIARTMRARLGERVRWLIPDAIRDLAATHWKIHRGIGTGDVPKHAVLEQLAANTLRLEQEALVLHASFPRTCEELLQQSLPQDSG